MLRSRMYAPAPKVQITDKQIADAHLIEVSFSQRIYYRTIDDRKETSSKKNRMLVKRMHTHSDDRIRAELPIDFRLSSPRISGDQVQT